MHIPGGDLALETRPTRRRGVHGDAAEWDDPLESLLGGSIRLRDLYRRARGRTCDSQWVQLRRMFDAHYKEQVRLVDLLIDRVRVAGGAARIFAGTFLQDQQPCWDPGNLQARMRMLRTLLDAHELVLGVALSGGEEKKGDAWTRDLGVGQVVVVNEEQSRWICDLLGNRCGDPSLSVLFQCTSD